MDLPFFCSSSDNQLELWYRNKNNQRDMRFIAEFTGNPRMIDKNMSEIVKVLNKSLENEDLKVDENGALVRSS